MMIIMVITCIHTYRLDCVQPRDIQFKLCAHISVFDIRHSHVHLLLNVFLYSMYTLIRGLVKKFEIYNENAACLVKILQNFKFNLLNGIFHETDFIENRMSLRCVILEIFNFLLYLLSWT